MQTQSNTVTSRARRSRPSLLPAPLWPQFERAWRPPTWAYPLVIAFIAVACFSGVWAGPALGDHEALVAQCARDMRVSGDWAIPRFLGKPFVRKTPLPYWMVVGASYLFPPDPVTGLPVSASAARLPSAMCGFATILIMWKLASAMFGRRVGLVTALVAGSSIALLLYSPNATAEMPLTFCCTWAVAHFWFAVTARGLGNRILQLALFYIAMGFAMLAKGPAPIGLVGFPLAVWWFFERPSRVIAGRGLGRWRMALGCFLRDLPALFGGAFTKFWLIPGLLLFAAVFVPWMLTVGARHPAAWDVWNWQYLQRVQGDFPDTRSRGIFYYVPILLGLVMPWTVFILDAVVSPWVRKYARYHRGLLFVGTWAVFGLLSMALMTFKKPYYILPVVPGWIMLLSVPVAISLRRCPELIRRAKPTLLWGGTIALAVVTTVVTWQLVPQYQLPHVVALLGGAVAAMFGMSLVLSRYGRGWASIAVAGMATVGAFHVVWNGFGSSIDNVDKVASLAASLNEHGVSEDADLYWADRRPDARLSFYFNRRAEHMLDPNLLVGKVLERKKGDKELELMAYSLGLQLLKSSDTVYLIITRENYDRAKEVLVDYGRVLAEIQPNEEPEEGDWVIFTNHRGLASG